MKEILRRHASTFSDNPGCTDVVKMTIDVGDPQPIAQRPYRVPDKMKTQVEEQIRNLLDEGIIEESTSYWASPVVPVLKPNGCIRVCIDYRRLNAVTNKLEYYMPTLEAVLEKVGPCKIVSKLDMSQSFHQIEVDQGSRDYTTFVTQYGRYRYRRMPFGLKKAPAVFQQLMDKVLSSCRDCASTYIDDVLVYSADWDVHKKDLGRVLAALESAGITAKPGKCQFGRQHVEYLGHVIGCGSLAIPEHRVTAICDYKRPVNKKDMRAFLGLLSYYRKFVQNFADQSSILTPATSKMAPRTVVWTPGMLDAYNSLASKLCNFCLLTIPLPTDTYTLHTDASVLGLGAVLNVSRDGKEKPVAFFSRQLRCAEKRYSATELEALAVVAAVDHFLPYLHGRSFQVITDHKALEQLMISKGLNCRLQGFMLMLQGHQLTIKYREGRSNSNADGMSRQVWKDAQKPDGDECAEEDIEITAMDGVKTTGGNVGSILLCLGLRKYSLDLAYGLHHIFIIISLSYSICMSCVVVVLIHWSYRESALTSYNYSCVNRV